MKTPQTLHYFALICNNAFDEIESRKISERNSGNVCGI